jgi:hypothetical protein
MHAHQKHEHIVVEYDTNWWNHLGVESKNIKYVLPAKPKMAEPTLTRPVGKFWEYESRGRLPCTHLVLGLLVSPSIHKKARALSVSVSRGTKQRGAPVLPVAISKEGTDATPRGYETTRESVRRDDHMSTKADQNGDIPRSGHSGWRRHRADAARNRRGLSRRPTSTQSAQTEGGLRISKPPPRNSST